ncbi:MAG: class I adenylate-forming enzyme family protein [Candidatus Pacearchaeota archaeon]|jgi:acyl-CoA synthetase (AMP-forming)/AMP-acid ligase II
MQVKNYFLKFYLKSILRLNLPKDILKFGFNRNQKKIAIHDNNKEVSYEELYLNGKNLAFSLEQRGIKKGDSIGILMNNSIEYFEIRIASYILGTLLVPIIQDIDFNEIKRIIDLCNIKIIFYNPEIIGKKANFLDRDLIKIPVSDKLNDYENLKKIKGFFSKRKIYPKDLASINFSSGTTGCPKGIMLTNQNWINSLYSYIINSSGENLKEMKVLHILSLSTAGGTMFLPSWMLGFKNYFTKYFNEKKVVELILKNNIDFIFISPIEMIKLLEHCKENEIRLPLKKIIIGTERIPKPKLIESINYFGPIIQIGYGMAEALPPITLNSKNDYLINNKINEKIIYSVGKPLKGVIIKIINKDNNPIKEGHIGRIIIKSKTVSKGYLKNLELTKKRFKKGWFISNDYGFFKNGYLHILGREEDLITEDGMLFTGDIEDFLYGFKDIKEVCVIKDNGIINIFLALKNNKKQEIISLLDNKYKYLDLAFKINFIESIPINASGKINRKKLLESL